MLPYGQKVPPSWKPAYIYRPSTSDCSNRSPGGNLIPISFLCKSQAINRAVLIRHGMDKPAGLQGACEPQSFLRNHIHRVSLTHNALLASEVCLGAAGNLWRAGLAKPSQAGGRSHRALKLPFLSLDVPQQKPFDACLPPTLYK